MHDHIRMIAVVVVRRSSSGGEVGVAAMDNFDLMAAASQLVGQAVDKDTIPAKVVGRIESGEHAKAQGSVYHFSWTRSGFVEE
jgi:hypothetical protein